MGLWRFQRVRRRVHEVDGVKVGSVHDRADADAKSDQLFTPRRLLCIIFHPPGDVVHGAHGHSAGVAIGQLDQIDGLRSNASSRDSGEPHPPFRRGADGFQTEDFCQ